MSHVAMCQVYAIAEKYIVVTMSRTILGYWLMDDPITVLGRECNEGEFESTIFNSLSMSKNGIEAIPKSEDKEYNRSILKKMQQKSFGDLYRTSKSASVSIDGDLVAITPYNLVNAGIRKRYLAPNLHLQLTMKMSEEGNQAIAKAIRKTLEDQFKDEE